jgi:hypothetical protein
MGGNVKYVFQTKLRRVIVFTTFIIIFIILIIIIQSPKQSLETYCFYSVFYANQKSKMAATTGHSINTGPCGENTEIYPSLKLLH